MPYGYMTAGRAGKGTRRIAPAIAIAALAGAAAPEARADFTLVEGEAGSLSFGVNGAAVYVNEPNTCWGEPREGQSSACDWNVPESARPADRDVQWADGFVQARLTGAYDTGGAGRLFAEASAFAAGTRGAGDWSRYTEDESEVAPELYNIGWSSGGLLPDAGEDALKLTVGSQRFGIGDGFVIWDGVADAARKGAFYTAPRRAFANSIVARLDTGPLRAAAFRLGTDDEPDIFRDEVELAGFDLEYVDDEMGTLGASYMRVLDHESGRDLTDLSTFSARYQGHPFAAMPGWEEGWSSVFASGEYVHQGGDAANTPYAYAWNAEIGYEFNDAPWKPYLGYRHIRFSDDYYKLYPGFTRNWGTWFYGEVTTNWLWHTNLRVNMLQARAAPSGDVAITANLYDFDYDSPPASDRNATHEFNLIADWTINANMGMSVISGVAVPQDGITQQSGFGDENAYILGVYAWFSY